MNNVKNNVQLIGYLGASPEMKTLQSGVTLAKLRMAVNEYYKNASGEWQDDTHWFTVTVWNELARRVEALLKKGSHVMIQGRLVNRQYVDTDGAKRTITEVIANAVLPLDRVRKDMPIANVAQEKETDSGLPF